MDSVDSSSWFDRRLVFIDVESPNGRYDRVCLFAALFENGESLARLVDPETDFHPINSKIHGVTSDSVFSEPNFQFLWTNELAAKLENRTIVGYNVDFDLKVLEKTLAAYGIVQPIWRRVDLLPAALRRFDLRGYSLSDVANELGLFYDPRDPFVKLDVIKTVFEEIAGNEPALLREEIYKFW